MTIRRRARVTALTAFVLLGTAGAGVWAHAAGGDPADKDAAAAKARYIATVDALCVAAETALEGQRVDTFADEVAELAAAARSMSGTAARIEAVPPPPADAARLRREFVEPAKRMAARLTEDAGRADRAFRAGDRTTARKIIDGSLTANPLEENMRAFAERYGFRACAGQGAEDGDPEM
ncbi:hypothetical protein SMC26_38070 [Actinomadura fulvescens]|uniref:Uncharacterized protein n=1 Tax=Actinomadura fulvescens TaxID=46160 RepID=A0ABP6CTC2_9ACTN